MTCNPSIVASQPIVDEVVSLSEDLGGSDG